MSVERHFTSTAYVVARERTVLLWHRHLGMWLPPGGHCEPNEDPVEAAVREAEEESGYAVEVVPPEDLVAFSHVTVLPPPEVILVFDIRRPDQPLHQHIDHVYFTRAVDPVDFEAAIPAGPHYWASRHELEAAFSLPGPDGTLAAVAEDVRLLGVRAIAAAAAWELHRA